MSTKNSSSGGKDYPKQPPGPSERTGTEKRRKSAGFIETSDYKPNWLETGPLSPDMLPESIPGKISQQTSDEYETLQASLQQFYNKEAADNPEDVIPEVDEEVNVEPIDDGEEFPSPEMDMLEVPAMAEPLAEVPDEPPVLKEAVEPEVSLLDSETMAPPAEETTSPPPELWIQALLEGVDQELIASMPPVISRVDPVADLYEEPPIDEFIDEENEEVYSAPETVLESVPETTEIPIPKRKATPEVKKRRDRLSMSLFIISLLLLAAAAVIYFVNPFTRLALGSASLARPVSSPSIAMPRTGSGNWCLGGNFLGEPASAPRLTDNGSGGDILAEDRVFSLEYILPQPGTYEWQIIDCENADLRYPQAPAWITTTRPNQPVTFSFDSNERADPLFFPIPYVVSATDATTDYRIIGSFQDWNPDDTSGHLQQINSGLYQQVRRIARSGDYEGYVISGEMNQAIDAYGRTIEPIPFSFQTDHNGDYVVFLVDTDRGRASVMYDMSPIMTSLAFGNGYRLLSIALAGLAFLLLLGLLLRALIMRSSRLQMEAGCPRCSQQELMRIARRPGDRFLHHFGIPAYRYRCRNCTWEGMRLSEEGTTVSPGVALAQIDGH